MTATVQILSLLSLVISKAADFITTVRHVGQEGESNPLARRLFHRLGFRGGLIAVVMIWLLIVGFTYGYVWFAGSQFMQWLTFFHRLGAVGCCSIQPHRQHFMVHPACFEAAPPLGESLEIALNVMPSEVYKCFRLVEGRSTWQNHAQ